MRLATFSLPVSPLVAVFAMARLLRLVCKPVLGKVGYFFWFASRVGAKLFFQYGQLSLGFKQLRGRKKFLNAGYAFPFLRGRERGFPGPALPHPQHSGEGGSEEEHCGGDQGEEKLHSLLGLQLFRQTVGKGGGEFH